MGKVTVILILRKTPKMTPKTTSLDVRRSRMSLLVPHTAIRRCSGLLRTHGFDHLGADLHHQFGHIWTERADPPP